MGGGVESCRRWLSTGDTADRVGVIAPIDGAPKERATERVTEGLLLEREIMLALENESCDLICEVFRISLPESFMRGLNIAITCCEAEFNGVETEDRNNNTCIKAKLSSKDNLHSGQRGCLGDSW